MPPVTRVFVCSTYRDLIEERNAVLDAIRRLQLQHDSMEFFGARPDRPIETCLEEVRRSDLLVVIVGHKYGSYVPESRLSYSECEYNEGYSLGKPCLVYMRSDTVPILPSHMERDPEKMGALEQFKSRLNQRHTVAVFSDAQDLALSVAADLSRTIQAIESSIESPAQSQPIGTPLITKVEQVIQEALIQGIDGATIQRAIEKSILALLDAEGKRETRVFLSYAQPDLPVARKIAAGLREAGIDVWFAEDSLGAGDNIERQLYQSIAQSDCFIFLISRQSSASNWVQKELDQAIIERMRDPERTRLIPVRLDDTRVPALLRTSLQISISNSNVGEALPRLIEAVRSQWSPGTGEALLK